MERLTWKQIYADNPHFKGRIEKGPIIINVVIIEPYRIWGTNRFTNTQKYTCYRTVKDKITGYRAEYLWDSINKKWVLGYH